MSAEFVHMDMRSNAEITEGIADREQDGFDVVIANAGIARRQPFEGLTDDAGTRPWMSTSKAP